MADAEYQTAVVLSGGGARAAYQIGALRGVAQVLGRAAALPFKVITGTSAGAINAALLAAAILALADPALAARLNAYRAAQTEAVTETPDDTA